MGARLQKNAENLSHLPSFKAQQKAEREHARELADRELARSIAAAVAGGKMTRRAAQELMNDHARSFLKARSTKSWSGRGHTRRVTQIDPAPPRERRLAMVYVVGAVGHPIKIGVAVDPESRLAKLQTGSPARLVLHYAVSVLDAFGVERASHATLSAHRLEGEWFDVSPEVAIEVVQRAAGTAASSMDVIA